MKLTVHPDAEKDIQQAAAFYEREGSAVLAARFVAEFKKLAGVPIAQPGIGSPRARGRRGFSMRVFPYTVVYRASADEVEVLVVKHDRKRPGYGRART